MKKELFADVILPLAVKGRFTYRIPERLAEAIKVGSRVMIRFGNKKLYLALVCSITDNDPGIKNMKEISELIDISPVISQTQLKFWKWISEYYMCTMGEVLKAAMPAGSESSGKYRPKEERFLILSKKYSDNELHRILDSLSTAPKQLDILTAYLSLTGYSSGSDLFPVKNTLLLKESGALLSSVTSLVKKGILVSLSLETSSIQHKVTATEPLRELSSSQSETYQSIISQLKEKEIILLHGVTSSGKTELYIRLIDEQLKNGKQVLYLLPEIALTAQIITRLRRHFGKLTAVFHSRLTDAERIGIWNSLAQPGNGNGIRLIIGARSSLFLPFHDPGLIIIDEEHDSSYKQHDPAPRYNARDSAIMMASMWKAKTILGSATPSVETMYNAFSGRYGYVWLGERYGKINLPEIIIANTREAYRKKQMVSHFSPQLLNVMDEALGKGEQIILFRNRRGFSPYIECSECGWIPTCNRCAVNLTYHKEINRLVCHYCGSASIMPSKCGSCGNISLVTKGFGTEKIEDEIKIVFPEAKVARMDQDTTRNKNSVEKIISAFENGQTDILIGTQMISKGLDFENLTVVGVLNADGMLNYPDFRAHERAFQMMSQVSGRAGRRQKHGRVIIQTSDPANKVIQRVLNNDFMGMYESQLEERKLFIYPPFCRLVRIVLKHRDKSKLNEFCSVLGDDLKKIFGARVLGPEFPPVSRIQSWYIKNILIKVEKDKPMARARELITVAVNKVEKISGAASLRINIDVDPY
ncbi:MAG: primosomal protein N' [Bacteroidales bacterium]|jgi:primosomal protein N' (replication factor Y)